ncbi:dUTP diphosphatase [Brevibacterium album]|uniref:dUTP diphosphatase n=1 Tax=Brevibacterium album TaxID=417948 RepID=UPI000403FDF8|nr:dUTP diphosphatase [Brevibacterium album]
MTENLPQVQPQPSPRVPLRLLDPSAAVPAYAHADDAGADLRAAEDVVLEPFARRAVSTGVAIALPAGCAGFVHPRSGLATKHGITVANAPGTIDAGYRGEVKVALVNLDPERTHRIAKGDRIAQLVVQRVERAEFTVVESLDETVRGTGGFGSTGGFAGSPDAEGAQGTRLGS